MLLWCCAISLSSISSERFLRYGIHYLWACIAACSVKVGFAAALLSVFGEAFGMWAGGGFRVRKGKCMLMEQVEGGRRNGLAFLFWCTCECRFWRWVLCWEQNCVAAPLVFVCQITSGGSRTRLRGALRFFWKIFLGPNHFFTPFSPKIYPFFKELTFFWISMGGASTPWPPWIRLCKSLIFYRHTRNFEYIIISFMRGEIKPLV